MTTVQKPELTLSFIFSGALDGLKRQLLPELTISQRERGAFFKGKLTLLGLATSTTSLRRPSHSARWNHCFGSHLVPMIKTSLGRKGFMWFTGYCLSLRGAKAETLEAEKSWKNAAYCLAQLPFFCSSAPPAEAGHHLQWAGLSVTN